MDLSCRLRRFRSSLDRPCTDFRFSRRQVTDQTEKMITCADQFFKTRLFQSQFLKEHRLFVIIKLGNLFFYLRTYNEHFTVLACRILTNRLYSFIVRTIVRKVVLRYICRKNNRFCSQKIITCKPLLLVLVICHKAFRHFIVFQMRFHTI